MGQSTNRVAIYLKAKLEEGLSQREVVARFGKNLACQEIIPPESAVQTREGGLVKILLSALREGKDRIEIKVPIISGGYRTYLVPKVDVVALNLSERYSGRLMVKLSQGQRWGERRGYRTPTEQGVYLEVMHNNDRERTMPEVRFDKGGSQHCKVYAKDLYMTDREYGFLKVKVSEDSSTSEGVTVVVRSPNAGFRCEKTFKIPERYVKSF